MYACTANKHQDRGGADMERHRNHAEPKHKVCACVNVYICVSMYVCMCTWIAALLIWRDIGIMLFNHVASFTYTHKVTHTYTHNQLGVRALFQPRISIHIHIHRHT
jgi:hypothetical protein